VLTAEHVPPQSFGGRELLLTCKKCNNDAGTLLDAHARHKEDLAEVTIRPPRKPLKVRVEHQGRKQAMRPVVIGMVLGLAGGLLSALSCRVCCLAFERTTRSRSGAVCCLLFS
jgi:hypothetical protein